MVYKSTLSKRLNLISILISIILITILLILVIELNQLEINPLLIIISILAFISVPIYFLLNSPKGFSIQSSHLNVHFLLHTKRYPITGIVVTHLPNFKIKPNSGSKGFFGYIGTMNGDKVYVKDEKNVFKIEYMGKSTYYSCSSSKSLIEKLN